MFTRAPFVFRDVWRSIKAEPASAILAVVSMAICIGAAASVLSVVDTTMLRPLPYPEPKQIFELSQPNPALGRNRPFSYRFFYEAEHQLPMVQSLAALSFSDMVLQSKEPAVLSAVACSATLFDLLKVAPVLGRPFDQSEEQRSKGSSVVLISTELWRSRFGGDPGILGQTLRLNDRSFVVIGVMPPRMRVPPLTSPAALWIPLGADPMLDQLEKMFPQSWDRSVYLDLWARIPIGEGSIQPAEAQIRNVAMPLLSQTDPHRSEDVGLGVISIEEKLTKQYRPEMYVLLLATLMTLIVACANVSSVMLARGVARRKGAAIRIALGAKGAEIAAGALLESMALAIFGAAAGLLLSKLLLRSLELRLPEGVLPFREIPLSPEVIAWALIGSAICGIAVAVTPAMRLAGMEARMSELWARGSTESRSTRGSREVIVVIQIACAALSLLFFLLLFRSYRTVTSATLGFDHQSVLVADLTLPQTAGMSGDRLKELGFAVERRLRDEAGVESASIAISAPTTRALRTSYSIAGEEPSIAEYRPVGADYFSVLRTSLRSGRVFTDAEMRNAPSVCLINETMARMHFPNGGELGARIEPNRLPPCLVVGVVGDVASRNPYNPPAPAIYVPFGQMPSEAIQGFMSFLVRVRAPGTIGEREHTTGMMAQAIREIAPTIPVEVHPLTAIVDERSSVERFRAFLMGAVSLIAAILAALGIYGITAHYVLHRRREMAIRMALGATASRVIAEVVKRALRLAALGLGLCFIAIYPVFKLIEGLLVGAQGPPLWAMASAAGFVALLALLSAYFPSRRITQLMPGKLLDKG